jgi:hypothetical protein
VAGQQRLLSELSGLKQSIDRARAKSRVGGERLMEDSQVSSHMACVFVLGFFCSMYGLMLPQMLLDEYGKIRQSMPEVRAKHLSRWINCTACDCVCL